MRIKKAVEAKRLEKKQQKKRDKKFERKNHDKSLGHENEPKQRERKRSEEDDAELNELRALQYKIEKYSGGKDDDDNDVIKKSYKPFVDSTKKRLVSDLDLNLPNNMKLNKKKHEKVLKE